MPFTKRGIAAPKLPIASKLSAYNGALLVSTGVPSLDDILGGGIPIGTVLLIEQDEHTDYARTLLRYWTAQGLAADNPGIIVSGSNITSREYVKSLPWLTGEISAPSKDPDNKEQTEMTIAWRYKNLKQFDQLNKPTSTPSYCDSFDLTKKIPDERISKARIHYVDVEPSFNSDANEYMSILEEIRSIVDKGFNSRIGLPEGKNREILRISIDELGSASFASGSDSSRYALFTFLHNLRGILRFSFAAAVITIPAYLYPFSVRRSAEHICDGVLALESFAGLDSTSPLAPYFDDYHGFLRVIKLPVVNSLISASTKLSVLASGGKDAVEAALGFKLHRKRFTIERVHLPIEGGTSERKIVHNDQDPKRSRTITSCASKAPAFSKEIDSLEF